MKRNLSSLMFILDVDRWNTVQTARPAAHRCLHTCPCIRGIADAARCLQMVLVLSDCVRPRQDVDRPLFDYFGESRMDHNTGTVKVFYSRRSRAWWQRLGETILLIATVVVIATCSALIYFKTHPHVLLGLPDLASCAGDSRCDYITGAIGVLNGVMVSVLNAAYQRLATKIVSWQNWETQGQFSKNFSMYTFVREALDALRHRAACAAPSHTAWFDVLIEPHCLDLVAPRYFNLSTRTSCSSGRSVLTSILQIPVRIAHACSWRFTLWLRCR